jgi:CRISPR type I-E-associated protein CasA/Cse1
MNTTITPEIQFNALTDAWVPLLNGTQTVWASPVEILCGEKDGPDLDYPRDDFRIYARLLLSALVQALFPAKTKQELADRLNKPLSRADVEARIAPLLGDFDLFGPTPFLQVTPPATPLKQEGAAPFVFPAEDLFRAPVAVSQVSLPLALVVLFAEQTYAAGAGRGYGAGPAGQLGVLTLVDPGTVRQAAWANSLTLELTSKYASDPAQAWSNAKGAARPRASIGLVGGLFFQPRGIWLIPTGEGICSFTGHHGPLVRWSRFLSKSELTKKASGKEDLWQHPCAPLAVNSQGIAAVRLNADRPAWTGLAQLLDPLTEGKKAHPSAGPAPVLQQWRTLAPRTKRPRLLVLDFQRDKANVKRRFFEAFPLTDHLVDSREAVDLLRALIKDAQDVHLALDRSLLRAHDDRKRGGLATSDARSAFWGATEGPFLDWLEAVTIEGEPTSAGDAVIELARQRMHSALRQTALALFDEHVAMSEFDLAKQERIAKARRQLRGALYPRPKETAPNMKEGNPNDKRNSQPLR